MTRIAVGLPDHLDDFGPWLASIGAEPSQAKLASGAMVWVRDVDAWLTVPPPAEDIVWVKLTAPEPVEGERVGWLECRPGEWLPSPREPWCCWTSDLVAVVV